MYGLRNSELSTCLFQFSHKTRQTMLLYAYFTPKVDFKRKFNHHQSFLYEWRLTAVYRKFRIGPSIRIESRIGHTIWNRIESQSFAGPYLYVPKLMKFCRVIHMLQAKFTDGVEWSTLNRPGVIDEWKEIRVKSKQQILLITEQRRVHVWYSGPRWHQVWRRNTSGVVYIQPWHNTTNGWQQHNNIIIIIIMASMTSTTSGNGAQYRIMAFHVRMVKALENIVDQLHGLIAIL